MNRFPIKGQAHFQYIMRKADIAIEEEEEEKKEKKKSSNNDIIQYQPETTYVSRSTREFVKMFAS